MPNRLAFAAPVVVATLLLVGCSSDKSPSSDAPAPATTAIQSSAGGPSSAASNETSTPSGDACPILASADLDAVVGVHLTDHFKSTTQPTADSPFSGTVLCDFANSVEERTAKVARGDVATVGTVQDMLRKVRAGLGVGADACPSVPGVGEQAFVCSDAQQAVVVAQGGGHVVMAYRGGKPGGAEMVSQAAAIAKLVLAG